MNKQLKNLLEKLADELSSRGDCLKEESYQMYINANLVYENIEYLQEFNNKEDTEIVYDVKIALKSEELNDFIEKYKIKTIQKI